MTEKGKQRKKKETETAENCAAVLLKLEEMREHMTVHFIDIDRIAPPPLFTRKRNVDKRMIESIRRYGLLQPLTVRRSAPDNTPLGGIFTLICGSERLEALKRIGFKKAPCYIVDLHAGRTAEAVLSIAAPESAEDLFRFADAVARYCALYPSNEHAISEKLCLTAETLSALLRLARAEPAIRRKCREAGLTVKLLLTIGSIPSEEDRASALRECCTTQISLQQTFSDPFYTEGKRRGAFVSLLPLINSAERLSALMRASGFASFVEHAENDDEFVIRIHVRKQSARILVAPGGKDGLHFG